MADQIKINHQTSEPMRAKAASESGHLGIGLNPSGFDIPSQSANGLMATPEKCLSQRILVPFDFNNCSWKALLYASQFACQSQSKIVLLHVLPSRYAPGQKYDPGTREWILGNDVRDTTETLLARFAKEYVETEAPVEIDVRYGPTASQIAEVAQERKIDLIIMGTHGYNGWVRLLIGSVADKVSRLAPCPVLAVRSGSSGFRRSCKTQAFAR